MLSIKSECLNRMMLFGETGLRQAVTSYIEHYRTERPHQGIGNEVIEGRTGASDGVVQCTERLGGLIKHYHRAA
jgi:putative transposase